MSLKALEDLVLPLRHHVSRAIELPEATYVLDLSSRQNDPIRQFKHLHQMCLMHAEAFALANQIKLVSLIDGYLHLSQNLHPLGPYMFARSMVELSAFIFYISSKAQTIFHMSDHQWKTKGEEFFELIVRARFGTSDPQLRQFFQEQGMPSHLVKPFRAGANINALDNSGFPVKEIYAKLCDFVHHNLSSQITSSPGFRIDSTAYAEGGGRIHLSARGPVTRYEYPVPSKGEKAIRETVVCVIDTAKIMIKHLNAMPRTPFGEAKIKEITGSNVGFTIHMPGLGDNDAGI